MSYSGATISFNFPKMDQPYSTGLFPNPSALHYYIHFSLIQIRVKSVNTLCSKDNLRNTSIVTPSLRGRDGVSPPYKNNRHIIFYIYLQNYVFVRTALFWLLSSKEWQFLTDVSEQPIGPKLTLEEGTKKLSRNVGKKLLLLAA
jgi:hypothetical protein